MWNDGYTQQNDNGKTKRGKDGASDHPRPAPPTNKNTPYYWRGDGWSAHHAMRNIYAVREAQKRKRASWIWGTER